MPHENQSKLFHGQIAVKAVYLHDGYASDRGLTGWYRDLSVREAKRLGGGQTLYAVDKNNRVREVSVNGASKDWKTFPGCILSLKYGLKERFKVGDKLLNPDDAISLSHDVRIVVPVKHEFTPDTPWEIVKDYVLEHEMKG